jgi:DNA-binding NarL/FixJ family response regulator
MKTRLLLVDDHAVVREGLCAILALEPDMQVVGEADDGRAALGLMRSLAPDVVVMDISMTGLNGVDATRQLLRDNPAAKVVVLSMHADESFVLAALEAGAAAYVVKAARAEELVRAIRAVAADRRYLCADVAGVVMNRCVNGSASAPAAAAFALLTGREREVLQLVAEGHTSPAIAGMLHVSDKTVETHRHNLMQKLDLHSVADLTKCAVRNGLTGA